MKPSELLSDPAKWTKGEGARDKSGVACDPEDPQAVCFCFLGSIDYCFRDNRIARLSALETVYGNMDGVVAWNDAPERTHAEVVAKLKELGP